MIAKKKPATKRTKRAPKKGATRKRSKPDWAPAFLKQVALTSNISVACVAAKVGRATVYQRRDADKAFAGALAEALESATDALELEARRRALDGCDRPVFHQGEQCGVIREYSDTLMIFLLKAHRPEKYRERSEVRHTGGTLVLVEEIVDGHPDQDAAATPGPG